MTRFLNKVFSMSLMALFLLAFFIAIGWATFVENDFGTPVAQKIIYKAFWFEGIIAYLFLALIYNIFRYKLFQLKKLGSLVFHVAFLVIVIGAWLTRTFGFEGAMLIREGQASNLILSYDTYVQIKVHDLKQQYVYNMPTILDGYTNNDFEHSFSFPGESEPISIEFVSLMEGVKDTLIPQGKSGGDPYLELVTVGQNGRDYNYLKSGDVLMDQNLKIAFNSPNHTDAISIFNTDSGICVKTPYDLTYLQMSDQSNGLVLRDSVQRFMTKRLYSVMGTQFVFNAYYPSAKVEMIESESVTRDYKAVTVLASQGSFSKQVVLKGGKGMFPQVTKFDLGNLHYELAYGSNVIELPFFIYLDDFVLERYPGTDNPSSYSSYVTVTDPRKPNDSFKHHIFMNNVLDYGGYRFFQSNYDPDELGTILSVNFDAPGTNVTYLGYFLLGLGFVISLFSRSGRFRYLIGKASEVNDKRLKLSTLLFLIGLFVGGQVSAQDPKPIMTKEDVLNQKGENPIIDYEHAEKFGRLVVHNQNGRFQPVHTLATEILKKVSRSTTYHDQSAMQVFLGVHTNSLAWNMEPIIYVSGAAVRKKLNLPEKEYRASFVDFLSFDFQYLLYDDVEKARLKKPSEQSQYDKDVLKTDERFNVMAGVFSGNYLKIIPLPNDSAERWYSPFDVNHPFLGQDAEFMNSIIPLYNTTVNRAFETGNWEQANQVIDLIDLFQRKVANPETIPSKSKIELEITYNKMDVFKKLMNGYLILGFALLILQFIQLFNPKFKLKWPIFIGLIFFSIMFVLHGVGLGMRWYLSGHAPWSNGYEAVVFVAFIVALAGILFYRKAQVVLGAAGVLAWLMLFVAHMNDLDPEITNLVPVLKSYWLMIHVAVITGSYAFLGLGGILGLICILMNLFVSSENKKHVFLTTKQITYVSEMALMIGLFMLTIGTFLGGVWANESWGRYWGWDAKETWALASVLIYAIVLHLRFIPFLKSQFVFNVASLWAYSTILMTFFGVNFYLDGLHSYAQGDPMEVPLWVPIIVTVMFALTVVSGLRLWQIKKSKE